MNVGTAIQALSTPDYVLMRRVHRWRAPRWVRYWALVSTRAGDGWLWGAYGIALLTIRAFAPLAAAALAATAAILTYCILKKTVGRKRPCAIEPHCWATLLPPDQFSFPSGHAVTAFAVAVSIGRFFPELRDPLLLCAASVAVSRILLGMHFLTDVLAGSALGCALGQLAYRLVS